MKKLLNRKEALGMIDAIFTSLHFNLISIKDLGIENSKERDYFLTEAWKIDQGRLKKDYEQTVNSLDAIGFKEYYKLIGKFATKYKIGCWKEYNEYEPILIEELNEELRKYDKTEDKLELINSFTVDELQSESFIFDSKVQVLYDILDDFNVGNNKEEGINTVLESFNSSDKASFIAKLQTEKKLLNAMIDKVNGTQKDEMLALMGEMFIQTGFVKEGTHINLDNGPKDKYEAIYENGKVYITVSTEQPGGIRDYRMIKKSEYYVDALETLTLNYDNRQITVPALILINSWQNKIATPEGLFYNYLKEDLNWQSLSQEEKDKYFSEFVMHYLPSGFFAAIGNPVHVIAVSLISACFAILTGGTNVMAEVSLALSSAGIIISGVDCGFAVRDIVNIGKIKNESQTVHEVKQAAKLMAKHIARLTLNGIDIICNFVDIVKSETIIKNEKI